MAEWSYPNSYSEWFNIKWKPVRSDVPQGSACGPMLYFHNYTDSGLECTLRKTVERNRYFNLDTRGKEYNPKGYGQAGKWAHLMT